MTTIREDLWNLTLRESSTPTIKDLKTQESNLKPAAGSYELKSGIIRIAAKLSFSGAESENPYKHLEKFSEICHSFQQGVPAEWYKWNLFPFTLIDKAQRWYPLAAKEAQGDWGLLVQKFITKFVPNVKVHKLRKQVWNIAQKEDEDIDEAWERLNDLLTQGPQLGVTSDESLQIFYFGLTSETSRYVNMCAGGSLMSKSTSEANEILSNIFFTSKEERERKEREAEEAEVDKGAPTVEAQLPTF